MVKAVFLKLGIPLCEQTSYWGDNNIQAAGFIM